MVARTSAPRRDQRKDRIACLAWGVALGAIAGGLAWAGAPRLLVGCLIVVAAGSLIAGLFARLWWLRNIVLFQFRAM